MSSVAQVLRSEALAAARGQTPQARLEQALRLGDSDVELRRAGAGASAAEARRTLERQRAAGRRPSASAGR